MFRKEFGGKKMCVMCTTYRSLVARVEQLQFLAAPFLESETKTKLIYTDS